MKKWFSLLAACVLAFSMCGIAEAEIDLSSLSMEDLVKLQQQIEQQMDQYEVEEMEDIDEIDQEPTPAPSKAPTKAPTKVPTKAPTKAPATLKYGMRSGLVTKLQKRLIALRYLSGKATGTYDKNTVNAVKEFQKAAGLSQTGQADAKTQERLYSSDAPKKKVYLKLNYNTVSRQPNKYKGTLVQVTGYVLQVLEDYTYQDILGVYTEMRVATKGKYDNAVYVTWWRPKNSNRILEDDKVTVYGTFDGLYTYTAVLGNSITLPSINADLVKRK